MRIVEVFDLIVSNAANQLACFCLLGVINAFLVLFLAAKLALVTCEGRIHLACLELLY